MAVGNNYPQCENCSPPAAAKTMKEKKPWRKTPMIEPRNLSKAAGCRILLKLENLQPGGSFKSRGVGNYVQTQYHEAANPDRTHFYSSSGGNAGLACVCAANFLGRPSTVVVPMSTKPMMIAKIKSAGASDVVQHGATWKEADAYLREVVIKKAEEKGEEGVYCPPFDHPDVWAGNETVIDEIDEQLQELGEGAPDVVVCSVGGGGLFNGITQGVEKRSWDTTVLAVETQGAHALSASLAAGEHVTLPGITSQATSLGAVKVSERTYELATKHRASSRVKSAVLSDAEAAMGCWRFADDEGTLVELACGVNLALCYGGRLQKALGRPVKKDEKVVIVACGGNVVSTEMIESWRAEYGELFSDEVTNGQANGQDAQPLPQAQKGTANE